MVIIYFVAYTIHDWSAVTGKTITNNKIAQLLVEIRNEIKS